MRSCPNTDIDPQIAFSLHLINMNTVRDVFDDEIAQN